MRACSEAAGPARHDAAVQRIDTSDVRVHQHAACISGWRVRADMYVSELGHARSTSALRFPLRWIVPGIILAYVSAGHLLRS